MRVEYEKDHRVWQRDITYIPLKATPRVGYDLYVTVTQGGLFHIP